MENLTDKELITKYRLLCEKLAMSKAQAGRFVGKTREWGRLLMEGKLNSGLNTDTRSRIKQALGKSE